MAAIGEQNKKRPLRQYTPLRFERLKTGSLVNFRFILQEKVMAKRKSAVKNGNGDLEFANRLWSAANRLRGTVEAAEYKHIILGLLLLKYLSDAFENRPDAASTAGSSRATHSTTTVSLILGPISSWPDRPSI